MSKVANRVTMIWLAIGAVVCSLLLAAGQAQARLGEFSLHSSFKVGEIIEGLAVDESTGDLYVYDTKGIIFKFDAEGNPVDFSALGGNEITGVGSYGTGEAELAVDNSSGPAKGDIYLTAPEENTSGGEIKIFGPDGTPLGKLSKVEGQPWGEACGVAVDGSGNVYVGLYPSNVNEYTPTTNPVTNSDYTGSHVGLNEICEIAAAPNGAVYASTWNPDQKTPIVEFNSIHEEGARLITETSAGRLAVANSPSAELFFSHPEEIFQYDSAGNPLSGFGSQDYTALTVNAKNGRVYAWSNDREIEIWQGVIEPAVSTGRASALDPVGTATMNGSVNPEGASVESCSFEYGIEASYGSTVPCAQSTPLTGSSQLPVSADLSSLRLNHTYHYRLGVTDAHGALKGADETFTILVRPTVDASTTVSAITRASAIVTGALDPEEGETSYHFEYGTTAEYGQNTPTLTTGATLGDVTATQQLQDLMPETTYHYRLVAKNVAGLEEGSDHTFVTGPASPPGAQTGAASAVAQNTAAIMGTVEDNGLPTSYGFEIGTSTDYGPPTGLGYVGAGNGKTPVSLGLTGLQPGTTYHYRLTASNVDGTVYGTDRTFTTSVYPSTFVEPPAPLPFVTVPEIAFPSEVKAVVKTTKKKVAVKKKAKPRHGGRKKAHGKDKGKRKR